MKGITVRNQTRAMAIDRAAKTLLVRNVVTGEEEKLPYDKLVLATGATPRMPPVEGHDLKNVLTLTRLEAADVIRKACEQHFADIGLNPEEQSSAYENAQARERTTNP